MGKGIKCEMRTFYRIWK